MIKLLIVDDEPLLVKGMKINFEKEGYEVVTADNGKSALELAESNDFDLILLDVMMPEMDGLETCSRIREFSDVPVIMLTAKTEDMDKLLGFENGADDYVTKPFNILELKARVRAVLRRRTKNESDKKTLTIGEISLNTEERNAYLNGNIVDLTAKEFDVIEILMKHPNRVYSREALLDTVWSYDYRSEVRTVDVHIRRLREKLERDPANPEHIMTKWGVGYYFKG